MILSCLIFGDENVKYSTAFLCLLVAAPSAVRVRFQDNASGVRAIGRVSVPHRVSLGGVCHPWGGWVQPACLPLHTVGQALVSLFSSLGRQELAGGVAVDGC